MSFNKQAKFSFLFLAGSCAGISTAYALEADEIFRRVQESVMLVKVYDAKDSLMGTGSAVLVSPENLLTSCHVLAKAKRIEIKQDNVSYGAELVHIDLERDLCQIRARNYKAKPVELGNSDNIRVGMKVYALGNPRGLELTLSDGLVSALRKESESSLRYIQTTAPISPGSSGGGLFDSNGKLIGITTMYRVDSQNLNFAIPINMFRELPERSKAALAKAAEKTAASSSSNVSKTVEKQEEKHVLDQELRDHFSQARKVFGSAAGTQGTYNVSLETSPNGKLRIRNLSKNNNMPQMNGAITLGPLAGTDGVATWRLKDADKVCLNFQSIGFSMLQGCYRLFVNEPKKYTLRSVEDSSYIQYTDE
jgi:hypothetical protein